MKESLMQIGDSKFKIKNAEGTRQLLEHVRRNAEKKGLIVNEAKTLLMCISAARSFEARVELSFGGQSIKGSNSLKILGVNLDCDCSFSTHVDLVAKRLRRKTWALSKLRRKGMQKEDLVQAYKTLIRPTAEYCSPVRHSSITAGQSEFLERQQTQALKNIFGTELSSRKMRVLSGLERLWTRRKNACKNLALKNILNPRCNGWFEERPAPLYARRAGTLYNKYYKTLSRTDRHRNSPLNYTRRLLNKDS